MNNDNIFREWDIKTETTIFSCEKIGWFTRLMFRLYGFEIIDVEKGKI